MAGNNFTFRWYIIHTLVHRGYDRGRRKKRIRKQINTIRKKNKLIGASITMIDEQLWTKAIEYYTRPTAWQMIKKRPILILYAIYHWCIWSKYYMEYEMKG